MLQNERFLDMLTSFDYGMKSMSQRNDRLLAWANFIVWILFYDPFWSDWEMHEDAQ